MNGFTTGDASKVFTKAAQATAWTRTNLGLVAHIAHDHYNYRVLIPHSTSGAKAVIDMGGGHGGTDFHTNAEASWKQTSRLVEAALAATRLP